MNEEIFWIWLLRCLGPAAPIADMLAYFGSARSLYEAGTTEWKLSGLLTGKQIDALSRYSPSESGAVLKDCRANGWHIVTPESPYYPQVLRELRNFPPVLFVDGDRNVLLRDAKISMVGTRKASAYSLRVAHLLSRALTACGMTVVSGGALGIDSAAHSGALYQKGQTIAVLGCGLGTPYLRENAGLRADIAKSGAVITEFLPYSPASRTTFPLRNRIIAALGLGTVVVEAGEKSGSLITARYALEQGRDVFAVPGDLISSAYRGANNLIRDGAKPVFGPLDILEEYAYAYPDEIHILPQLPTLGEMLQATAKPVPAKPQPKKQPERPKPAPPNTQPQTPPVTEKPLTPLPETAGAQAKAVYAALNGAQHIDALCEATGLPMSACLAALTELELYGCVTLIQGKKYLKI